MSSKPETPTITKEDCKQKSGTTEEIPKNVHSANNWEGADLGDDNRKKKFLRLMGASKKDHHGKIIIGDHDAVHARSRDETVHIDEDLEDQFKQGLEHKMASGFKGHLGLGFHKDEEDKKEGDEKTEDKEKSDKRESEEGEKGRKSPSTEKEESVESCHESPKKHKMDSKQGQDEEEEESVKKKMKLNFVKASS
uniref:Small acidic protein n=1 Tax=Crassostrea virginica TaxID=6565 RepID=A0A8B8ATU2_CRAVI|nr:small acidic protein-like [Crassostrea virginica]